MAIARFEYDRAIGFLNKAAQINPDQKVRLLLATGELLEQFADVQGAERNYVDAVRSAEGPSRAEALAKLAALVERRGSAKEIVTRLSSWSGEADSELHARLGLAQLAQGQLDEAEGTLGLALDDPTASAASQARAEYGMAEVMLQTFKEYPPPEDMDLLQEVIFLVEVVEEGYLTAFRHGDPEFGAAALSRLSYATRYCAGHLRKLQLPPGLGAAEQAAIRNALETRAKALDATSEEARQLCADQAWNARVLTPIVRDCMNGKVIEGAQMVSFDALKPRAGGAAPNGIDELRQRISKNPEDVDGLTELGIKFLDAGDPHVARLAFARAVQSGGGPKIQNLLGIASYKAGDMNGAFEAFAAAAEAGVEAGRMNLGSMLRELGLGAAAEVAKEKFPEGSPGGRLISGKTHGG